MDDQKNPQEQPYKTPAPSPLITDTPPRRRRIVLLVVAVLIVAGAIVWWHPWNRGTASGLGTQQDARQGGRRGGGNPINMHMPQPVHVAGVTQGEMPVVINSLGTVTPLANVTVRGN